MVARPCRAAGDGTQYLLVVLIFFMNKAGARLLFWGCTARRGGRGGRAEEDQTWSSKGRWGAALARGLVVPVVVAEGLDWYLRVVVAAAASANEAATVTARATAIGPRR